MDSYVRHLPEHLFTSSRLRELYNLVYDRGWSEYAQSVDPSRGLFVQHTELAIQAAEREGESGIPRIVGISLAQSLARNLTSHFVPELLGAVTAVEGENIALSYANLIQNPAERFRAYWLIADQCIFDGRSDSARHIFGDALSLIECETDQKSQRRMMKNATILFGRMGRWDEALTVLKRISDAFVCLGTLCDLVEEALKQDNSTTVESLVNELLRTLATNKGDTPEWKVAKVISILGQLERFHDISRVFENLDVWETAVVASELAKSLSPAEISPIARLLDEKVTLAIDHVEPEYRIQVLGLAAQVSARTGNAPKARRLITEVLSQLGVDARDEDHSGRAVNSIEVGQKDRGGVKAWALLRSARALAYLGETKEAQHLLTHQLYGFSSQVEIILQEEVIDEAAQILIMIKEYSDAAFMPWTLFGNFRDRDTYLEKGLGRIAKELGEVGQYDHALAMLRHIIVNRQYLFDAMGAIGRAMADRGEFEKALELAGNINRVYGRLHLLSVISQDMARAGNLSGASQVLASALQLVKAWDTAALLHPDEDLILTLIRLSESLPPKDQDAPMLSSRTNPATKVRAVLELTKTHISGEDPQFIRKSVLENLTLVGEEKNPRIQAELYAECAGVAAYINDWDLVISIRETVKSMLDIGSGLKDNSRKSMSNLASRLRTLPSLNQNAQESMYRLLNLPVSDRRAIESAYHWIVSLLASQAASAGDLSRALGLATEIGESHTYQAIAEVLHRITLIFICHRNYNSAIFVAKQLRDEENVMVDTGHYDQMEDLTPVITQRSFYYSETVSELIKAWVEDERISEAKSFLDTIPNDYSRSMAMSALAGSLFRIGESSGADEAFAEALRLIDHCRDDCEATAARVAALFALIEMGRENEARQIMNTLRGVLQFKSSRSPETTGHIIRALLLLDPFDALNLVFEIQEKNEQLPALSFLAEGVKLIVVSDRERNQTKFWLEWHFMLLKLARRRSTKTLIECLKLFARSITVLMPENAKASIWEHAQAAIGVVGPTQGDKDFAVAFDKIQ